jgi:hypothetical protein
LPSWNSRQKCLFAIPCTNITVDKAQAGTTCDGKYPLPLIDFVSSDEIDAFPPVCGVDLPIDPPTNPPTNPPRNFKKGKKKGKKGKKSNGKPAKRKKGSKKGKKSKST